MSDKDDDAGMGCLGLIIIAVVLGGISKCNDWSAKCTAESQREMAEKQAREARSNVMLFLKDMNPELHKKVTKVFQEIALTDGKIQKLRDLKEKHPNHEIIDETLEQWQNLRKQLNQVSRNLYHKIEGAYIAYEIDKIQGRNNLHLISTELLKEANAALVSAEATKSIIEEQLR